MLDSVKIARRQSEIRQNLAELAGKETPTEDEVRSMETLDLEYRQNETRYRAALIAEDTERRDAGEELETRSAQEWAELMAGFELRQVTLIKRRRWRNGKGVRLWRISHEACTLPSQPTTPGPVDALLQALRPDERQRG